MDVLSAVREDRVAAVGREIFDRARQAEPSVLDASWWDERVLEWAMQRQRLNTQPARTPVNASPTALRPPTHDSGPVWLATP